MPTGHKICPTCRGDRLLLTFTQVLPPIRNNARNARGMSIIVTTFVDVGISSPSQAQYEKE